jgi:hypothetical protein
MLLVSACVTSEDPGGATAAALLESHVNGFAMAHCLRSVGDKGVPETDARVLREQGDRWCQVLVEHSRGDIFAAFDVLLPAIDAALESTSMALVKVEETGGSATAPVFYCDQLIRQPAVERAMAQARARLAPAYAEK